MFKTVKFVLTASAVATLVACGGGGDSGDGGGGAPAAVTPTLSTNQTNFEATAIKDAYVTFVWLLPTTNVAPTSGTNYFYTNKNSALTSPSAGPVLNSGSINNLTATLKIPDQTKTSADRVIKSGVIYASNSNNKQMWSYVGNNVVLSTYATDGVTPLASSTYDDWSAAIPLTGPISSSTVLKSFLGFSRLNTPLNFDFTQSWLSGASYFTRKGYRTDDTLFIWDWNGTATSYDTNVNAYPGTATTIEGYFASAAATSATGWSYDSVLYHLADGAISSIQGVRTWVATNKRPTSSSSTDSNLALMEIKGKLYMGSLQKSGARFRTIDGVDSTVVHDYQIRLNATAAASIKQTVKF